MDRLSTSRNQLIVKPTIKSFSILGKDSGAIRRDVRKLQDMFKTKLWIKDDPSNPGYVLVESTGSSENVDRSLAYIQENLPKTLSMDIHPENIGWIIGKGGENIRNLRTTYDVHATFNQNTLHIRGKPKDIEKARSAVLKRIQDKEVILERRQEEREEFQASQKKSQLNKVQQKQRDAHTKSKDFKKMKNSLNKNKDF